MTTKNFSFSLGTSSTLTLKSLYAQVNIRKGIVDKATVEMSGDEKLIELIKVIQNGNGVLIEGQDMGGGDITVIQNRSHSSISVRGNGVVIGGSISGARIITNGNVVILNGKVVSDGSSNESEIEDVEKPIITVTVPEGTELDAESVESLDSHGLNGKLYLSLDGQGYARVQDVNGAKISCSGQTRCELGNAWGDLKISCSGQSRTTANGSFGDVDVDSSGQSQIRVIGNCQDIEGSSSGQSTISLIGQASGKVRKHESGQSRIYIN